jgi:4-amino-4-deoxy-L-arabinose transferase-like glycosyltransferase
MMSEQQQFRTPWAVYAVLCFLFCTRLLMMICMPLNDKTEARYGEIARLMLASNNWVTLQQTPGEAFWAKPPLSTWSSAISMKICGVSAWAARLPALICALVILGLLGWFVSKRHSKYYCGYMWLILACMPYFLINAGVVMTDPMFVLSVTLSMIAAWLAMSHASLLWGYLFFIGLAMGLLAKGPLIGVLVIVPLMIWGMTQGKLYYMWKNLPWIRGSFLMLLLVLPWYLLAELRTPGFLNYFIMGEHFNRFLESGWQGDKYGFAHAFPIGTIWLFFLGGTVPWILFIISDLVKMRGKNLIHKGAQDGWVTYLFCFILVPLVFFTFSRNIIYTYTFTVFPALALLILEGIQRQLLPSLTLRACTWVAGGMGIACLFLSFLFFIKPHWVTKSQESVVRVWQSFQPSTRLIYWANEPDFSARFYTRGQVMATRDEKKLVEWLASSSQKYLVVREDQLAEITERLRRKWRTLARIRIQNKTFILYEIRQRGARQAFV